MIFSHCRNDSFDIGTATVSVALAEVPLAIAAWWLAILLTRRDAPLDTP